MQNNVYSRLPGSLKNKFEKRILEPKDFVRDDEDARELYYLLPFDGENKILPKSLKC